MIFIASLVMLLTIEYVFIDPIHPPPLTPVFEGKLCNARERHQERLFFVHKSPFIVDSSCLKINYII